MKTKRLIFSPFEKSDFNNYYRLVKDKHVMRMITGKPLSYEEAQAKFNVILQVNKAHKEIGYFIVRKSDTKTFIGLAKIVITQEQEAEIGYSLLPEHWGKGYASEISEELVRSSSKLNYINTLIAIIDPENGASRKILQKSNFKLERTGTIEGLAAEFYRLDF
ncbi:MAG: GNAT family N-acetyltransferase [Bacteroidales bacterium]|nr:GNAT family N-acetyltransferase [Bacteroidales bacterium]